MKREPYREPAKPFEPVAVPKKASRKPPSPRILGVVGLAAAAGASAALAYVCDGWHGLRIAGGIIAGAVVFAMAIVSVTAICAPETFK